MKKQTSLPAEIIKGRKMIYKLAKNDFRTKYAGSYLGIIWAFIQPVVTVLVYWFVFEVGFRAGENTLPVPFVLYLIAGILFYSLSSERAEAAAMRLLSRFPVF